MSQVPSDLSQGTFATPVLSAPHPQTGEMETFKRYQHVQTLKPTLQGYIAKAWDVYIGNWVAIKVANKALVKEGKSQKGTNVPENFLAESELLYRLSTDSTNPIHSGINRCVSLWQSPTDYYLALEYCNHNDLFDYCTAVLHCNTDIAPKAIDFPANKRASFLRSDSQYWYPRFKIIHSVWQQLISAVHWLHNTHNITHLDLSLENTMIAGFKEEIFNGTKIKIPIIKLIDFGLALTHSPHPKTGKFYHNKYVGKAYYAAPEVYEVGIKKRSYYDACAADIWSLGCMLYMLAFNLRPFNIAAQKGDPLFDLLMNDPISGFTNNVSRQKNASFVTRECAALLTLIFRREKYRISTDAAYNHSFTTAYASSTSTPVIKAVPPNVTVSPKNDTVSIFESATATDDINMTVAPPKDYNTETSANVDTDAVETDAVDTDDNDAVDDDTDAVDDVNDDVNMDKKDATNVSLLLPPSLPTVPPQPPKLLSKEGPFQSVPLLEIPPMAMATSSVTANDSRTKKKSSFLERSVSSIVMQTTNFFI